MTEDDFAEALVERHNTKDGIDSTVLKDIRGVVRTLTDAKRKELFDWYVENWRSPTCPRPAFFAERLRDTGQKSGFRRDEIRGSWICGNCETKYSLGSQGCPRCGSGATLGVYPDAADPRIVEVKPDCWTCSIYHDNDGYKFGPECKEWGSGARSLDNCTSCRCADCCGYEYHYRKGAPGDKMPWLDTDYWRKK